MTAAEKAVALAKAKREAAEIVRSRWWSCKADFDERTHELRRLAHAIYPVKDELRAAALAEVARLYPGLDDIERQWPLDGALAWVAEGNPPPAPLPHPYAHVPLRVRRALIALGCRALEEG